MSRFVSGRLVESPTLEAALEDAQMITLATKSSSPVLLAEHLRPGIHVNSVGPASRDRVEVDPQVFDFFDRVVCDSADLVLDEAGDAYLAVTNHGFEPERAEDLADVVCGRAPGRANVQDMTLFKSVGTGAQDLVVAARMLRLAAAADVGTVVDDLSSIKPLARER
jgi:ornithine cyclodeaminase/alanine dehydrogenase-like protein (mu-crystallin family)